METQAHHALKQLAIAFLRSEGYSAVATEVRCPISRYRVDVAGYRDRVPSETTVLVECKQSREDFLRDNEQGHHLLALRERLNAVKASIEEHRIKFCEPHRRLGGTSLFAELEDWDFAASRLPGYRRVVRHLRSLDRKLHGETKFFMIAKYRLADQMYIAAPPGMLRLREVPPGWGLLECEPRTLAEALEPADSLTVAVRAPIHPTSSRHRLRLLRNIAVAASFAACPSPKKNPEAVVGTASGGREEEAALSSSPVVGSLEAELPEVARRASPGAMDIRDSVAGRVRAMGSGRRS